MNKDTAVALRNEYISRVNKVQDYIEMNISESFSLYQLALIAGFSSFHFHRIFYSITGETLFQYIQRVRLEKAARLLIMNQNMSIMNIALECGFSNQSSFAKAYKNYFSMSAANYRTSFKKKSNLGKELPEILDYNSHERTTPCSTRQKEYLTTYQIEVKRISSMDVVYLRYTGPYKSDIPLFENLSSKLDKWAASKGLQYSSDTKWLTVIHDSPGITEDNRMRISYGMTIHESKKVNLDGEYGKMRISGGRYAIGHFELAEDEYQAAWNALYVNWLPENGYQPEDGISFELYHDNVVSSSGKRKVDIYIPVKPLRG